MPSSLAFCRPATLALAVIGLLLPLGSAYAQAPSLQPAKLPAVATVDDRFQSFNMEMVEVTGGRFWKPYASKSEVKETGGNAPTGLDPSLYEYRAPINLTNPKLRKLAAALGPIYLRVSGTWANTTFFQNDDAPALATPPAGFKGTLTRAQWKGVIDFANATNAKLVTSFSISQGTRDATGAWTPAQAQQFLDYTRSVGGHIAAAEFMNEPTFAEMGGAPRGYDATAFARDLATFRDWARKAAPDMIFLGPGSVGEGTALVPASMHLMKTTDVLTASGPIFDAFSYHTYGGVSSRCAAMGGGTTQEAALTEDWLSRGASNFQFYAAIRDQKLPGKPMWNTETAQTACGGDRWASTFLDSFRYLNQLGSLARLGLQVHMHNTLAASDYGLLDEKTYEPRPNYWFALLWHRLMGKTVLNPGPAPSPALHLYAQCLPSHSGGVTLLVLNLSRDASQSLTLPTATDRYSLTAAGLTGKQVSLNGVALNLGPEDSLPELKGQPTPAGTLSFAPASITFLTIPKANNPACRQ